MSIWLGGASVCGANVRGANVALPLFSLCGIVFCSAPSLIFFAGSMALCWCLLLIGSINLLINCSVCWSLTTSLSVLLALERCVEQTLPNLAKSLFKGCRIWGWCLPVLAYSLYYGFFTIPVTFSSITANWQFDPHIGYLEYSSTSGQNLVCFFL
ncbi:hypothetical protein niasHT_024069 [Heterodera trifolii]|uniref:Uncharacterized protein n=1 Tax=Heterodera trifolii TaxID=157864 RepID=A0ABD2JYW8_9BILA